MRISGKRYIFGTLITLLVLTAGCTDDFFSNDAPNPTSSEAVSFSATVTAVDAQVTRSAYKPYEPLVLNDDAGSFPLYLHDYEHPLDDGNGGEDAPRTRGMQIGSAKDLYDIHKSFGVKGVLEADGSTFLEMQKTKMLSAGDYKIWTTDVPQRWPGNKMIEFNAVAPYNKLEDLEKPAYSKNMVSFSYTARKSADGKTDAESQYDLLTAVSTMNREKSADYKYRVPLHFKHALCAVKFAVRDVLKGKVKSISIIGVNGKGDCIYKADDNSQNGQFTWSNQSEPTTYSQIFDHEIENGDFNPENEVQDVVLNNLMPEKTFMLIPQVIPDDAMIEVEIERYNLAPGAGDATIKVRGKIKANGKEEWKAGYEYIYTISTSKDNWVYVFDATGNQAKGTDNIYVYNPGADEFSTLGNSAYFNVQSYRYKANDQTAVEALPWTASHGGSESYQVLNPGDQNGTAYPNRYVTASQWITDTSGEEKNLKGPGLANKGWDRHNLDFLPHYVTTDYEGDKTMQTYEPYSGFTKENPYDLSTYGDKRSRTTANCYIVDRGGWYMLPLVYGNAIKDGATVTSSYTSANNLAGQKNVGATLGTFTDYRGNNITGPNISGVSNTSSAELVWQDAYNMINPSSVQIKTINGERMLCFFVERENLQQGNAIVALTDKKNGTIMWSWHIWATEHWLDPTTRLPHVFDQSNAGFTTFRANYRTGFRERGDVGVTHNQPTGQTYYMAPYNLGWCDPKRVEYLQRKSQMDFVQYMPDGSTKTGKIDMLPILQDGETIDYKYANNTYYQWGRKDPMRGFFDHNSHMKAVFGTRPSATGAQCITIATGINNPNVFYGTVGESPTNGSAQEDWCVNLGHPNLWNNNANVSTAHITGTTANHNGTNANFHWSHSKTVYDPCPAGYMVPNSGIFHFIFKQTTSANITGGWQGTNRTGLTNLKTYLRGIEMKKSGEVYDYKVYAGSSTTDDNTAIFFSATGNKWWSSNHLTGVSGGDNYNPQLCYLWSNHCVNDTHHGAQGMALGLDKDLEANPDAPDEIPDYDNAVYYISAHFIGRRAMGRAVRPIREY